MSDTRDMTGSSDDSDRVPDSGDMTRFGPPNRDRVPLPESARVPDQTPKPVRGIIIGHGDLPRALYDAAASIVGKFDGISVISNMDCSTADLADRLGTAIDESGGDNTIVFVDMFGSSCSTASARVKRNHAGIAVICGVNLPMLIRFLAYRERLEFAKLVELMQQTGQSAVKPLDD